MTDILEKLDLAARDQESDLYEQAAHEIRQLRTAVALLRELVKENP